MRHSPSDRSFGLLFAAICAALSGYAVLRHAVLSLAGWGTASVVLALFAWVSPRRLRPLKQAWLRFGDAMGRLVSPLVLGLLYFALLTPVAFFARLAGRDELRLRRRRVDSHWRQRRPPGPSPDSFRRQF